MSAGTLLAVGALGGAGAVARFAVEVAVTARLGAAFPFGTLAVNASGALLLGLLVGAAVSGDALRLAGAALLGSYTTFSAWMLETHRAGGRGLAAANLVVSLAIGLAAVSAGRALVA